MDSRELLLMIALSALLWLIYKTILSGQKTLVFNRFFLLSVLLLSVSLPFIHVNLLQRPVLTTVMMPVHEISPIKIQSTELQNSYDWNQWVRIGYWVVTGSLALRFFVSLFTIFVSIQRSKKVTVSGLTFILLKENHVPFCFLNMIFVSEQDFAAQKIEPEILLHEQTHAKQRHTLDILFAELVLIVFWFNPFFWLTKKSMVSNHEFLADENVLKQHNSIADYQRLIIEKTIQPYHNQFASNFNFMLTKKRFLMMKRKITKTRARVLELSGTSLLIIGLLLGLMLNAKSKSSSEIPPSNSADVIVKTIQILPSKTPKPATPEFLPYVIGPEGNDTLNPNSSTGIATHLDKPAEYKGGINEFRDKFQEAFDAAKVQANGDLSTQISFVINTDGSISDVSATGSNGSFNAEAVRAAEIASSGNNWNPGIFKGQPVRSRFRFPIKMNFSNGFTNNKSESAAEAAALNAARTKTKEDVVQKGLPSQQLDKVASFKRGINNFRDQFARTFNLRRINDSGEFSTLVTFMVDVDGSISDVHATGVNQSFNDEATRVVKKVSTGKVWNPTMLDGKPVQSLFKFPLKMNIPSLR